MTTGTKSILFGAHCFFIHPFEVAWAWTKLYGFPTDPRLWVAFFVHDLGYWGKEKMDDEEGEKHPLFGAKLMEKWFDKLTAPSRPFLTTDTTNCELYWYSFCLFHSRYLARKNGAPISPLCVADKLAPFMIPKWLYLLRVKLSGELYEYIDQPHRIYVEAATTKEQIELWYNEFRRYMLRWVEINRVPGYPYFHYERLPK